MLNATYWLVVIFLLLTIIALLHRKTLREKYAVVWFFMGFLLILGALNPAIMNKVSQILGFQFLSNFVLFIFGILNLLISMQLSLYLSKAENEIRTLAEEVALLNSKVDKPNN
jgi:hypothetical protein